MEARINEYGKMVINAEANVFVIPNHAAKIGEFFFDNDERANDAIAILNNLGKSFDEKRDFLVECWIHSTDLNSDNVNDHGFTFYFNDRRYRVCSGTISRYIPAKAFNGLVEGDSVELVYNIAAYDTTDRSVEEYPEIQIELHLNTKLDQLNYRYKKFGRFEEVVKKVCY